MSWIRKINKYFGLQVRERGRDYFYGGEVTLSGADATSIEGNVQGSRLYRVEAEYDPEAAELRMFCDCPYFHDRGEPCKHLYAALLDTDQKGLLQALEEGDVLEVDCDTDFGSPPSRTLPPQPAVAKPLRRQAEPKNLWTKQLEQVQSAMLQQATGDASWPPHRQVLYQVNVPDTLNSWDQNLHLRLLTRDRKADGQWGKPSFRRISMEMVRRLPDPTDRQVLSLLGCGLMGGYGDYDNLTEYQRLGPASQELLVKMMCQTERAFLLSGGREPGTPLRWDDGLPWQFVLRIRPDENRWALDGYLQRGDETVELSKPMLLTAGGLVFGSDTVSRLDDGGAFPWITQLRQVRQITVPTNQAPVLLQQILDMPRLPRLELPPELQFQEVCTPPELGIVIRSPRDDEYSSRRDRLIAEPWFRYGGDTILPASQSGQGVYDAANRRFIRRDLSCEERAHTVLRELGFREAPTYGNEASKSRYQLAPRHLPRVVRELTTQGWRVEAEGKLYRQPGVFKLNVVSGVDWFELHGDIEFEGQTLSLPAILKALKKGERTILLGDGTYGILPEQWLEQYGFLASLGQTEADHLKFSQAQAGLLDALLVTTPQVSWDAMFDQARQRLRQFQGIASAQPPVGFVGELRPYQKQGLGWLHFLRDFSFGGCLADDMGLGKTIQVLALLESRRQLREGPDDPARTPPSLVVVPRSLIFNWKLEAARFTPRLRVLDHTGQERIKGSSEHFEDYDLVLTTYGTLRRDAAHFKDFRFDYVILDEAQAIKNADTDSSKATRLLQADHRLALSGTPIENHIGELWSLLEFLNPGMLGSLSSFKITTNGQIPQNSRILLAGALRPFILRRTKQQVATDLPEKTEQTIYCELPAAQRRKYDELRDYYRKSLLASVAAKGLAQSKIQVLEALLRLRQAACHPGLIDPALADQPSAKLDALIPQLQEVLEEDHKVLVFSQFTSFLSLVRQLLDAQGMTYEYLDGQTRNRQEKVERFQGDPSCKLFLISLKAGGLGLNLTAAEYVYLLDPWWNPAVEAQAIDRAHRIGQTRRVFAYRLIAQQTVEEKVLELQKSKRDLADAIISADNSLIRDLTRDDLELLLS